MTLKLRHQSKQNTSRDININIRQNPEQLNASQGEPLNSIYGNLPPPLHRALFRTLCHDLDGINEKDN